MSLIPATDRSGATRRLADVERDAITMALIAHEFNRKAVAKALGIGRSTLYRRLHRHRLLNLEIEMGIVHHELNEALAP